MAVTACGGEKEADSETAQAEEAADQEEEQQTEGTREETEILEAQETEDAQDTAEGEMEDAQDTAKGETEDAQNTEVAGTEGSQNSGLGAETSEASGNTAQEETGQTEITAGLRRKPDRRKSQPGTADRSSSPALQTILRKQPAAHRRQTIPRKLRRKVRTAARRARKKPVFRRR